MSILGIRVDPPLNSQLTQLPQPPNLEIYSNLELGLAQLAARTFFFVSVKVWPNLINEFNCIIFYVLYVY